LIKTQKNPDAHFFEKISPGEVLQKRLGVIDAASIEILAGRKSCYRAKLHEDANIFRALSGEKIWNFNRMRSLATIWRLTRYAFAHAIERKV